MSSFVIGGTVEYQQIRNEPENFEYDDIYDYPFKIPKIKLNGFVVEYYPQIDFSWSEDKVILTYDNHVRELVERRYVEILSEDETGDIVWMDGRTAPYSGCWDGKYLDEKREACEMIVIDYDLEKQEKKTYKLVLESTESMSEDNSMKTEKSEEANNEDKSNSNISEFSF